MNSDILTYVAVLLAAAVGSVLVNVGRSHFGRWRTRRRFKRIGKMAHRQTSDAAGAPSGALKIRCTALDPGKIIAGTITADQLRSSSLTEGEAQEGQK